ncbi:MAG: hypothetical protein GY711_02375 [bacterium]|nr:hypothetical protein [bacterium]
MQTRWLVLPLGSLVASFTCSVAPAQDQLVFLHFGERTPPTFPKGLEKPAVEAESGAYGPNDTNVDRVFLIVMDAYDDEGERRTTNPPGQVPSLPNPFLYTATLSVSHSHSGMYGTDYEIWHDDALLDLTPETPGLETFDVPIDASWDENDSRRAVEVRFLSGSDTDPAVQSVTIDITDVQSTTTSPTVLVGANARAVWILEDNDASPLGSECNDPLPASGAGPFAVDTQRSSISAPSASCMTDAAPDVWFQWTSGPETSYDFSVSASYDSALELYSGPCTDLVSLACFDGPDIANSLVSVGGLAPSTDYFIRVGGSKGDTGTASLSVSPFLADTCASAVALAGTGTFHFNTGWTSTTLSQAAPGCWGTVDRDVWFTWTAEASGGYTFASDAPLEILDNGGTACAPATTCSSLTSVGCSAASGSITLAADYGKHYFVRAGTNGGSADDVTISLIAPTPSDCSQATVLVGTAFETYTTSGTHGFSCAPDDTGAWFRWTAEDTADYTFSNCGTIGAILEVFDDACCTTMTSLGCDTSCSTGGARVDVAGVTRGDVLYIHVGGPDATLIVTEVPRPYVHLGHGTAVTLTSVDQISTKIAEEHHAPNSDHFGIRFFDINLNNAGGVVGTQMSVANEFHVLGRITSDATPNVDFELYKDKLLQQPITWDDIADKEFRIEVETGTAGLTPVGTQLWAKFLQDPDNALVEDVAFTLHGLELPFAGTGIVPSLGWNIQGKWILIDNAAPLR